MNIRKKHKPADRAVARNAVLINLFASPGMGSLMAGRYVAGLGQLAIFLTGFARFVIWFVKLMAQCYGMITGQEAALELHAWLGISAVIIVGISWLWALATSISLMNEARRNESAGLNLSGQPRSGTGSN